MGESGWVMPTHIIAAAGVVTNEKDEVLLVKTYNSGWVFPGGQVEVGENVIDGVKREIMENSESMFVPKDKVLELIKAPAIIERYKAYLEYENRPIYMEYVTKPEFKLKLKRLI